MKKITEDEAARLTEGIRERAKGRKTEPSKPPSVKPPETRDPETRALRVNLPTDLWKALQHMAIDHEEPVSALALKAIQAFVERHRKT